MKLSHGGKLRLFTGLRIRTTYNMTDFLASLLSDDVIHVVILGHFEVFFVVRLCCGVRMKYQGRP